MSEHNDCASCRFSREVPSGLECRRVAPRPVVALAEELTQEPAFVLWPVVNEEDWCSEWRHK